MKPNKILKVIYMLLLAAFLCACSALPAASVNPQPGITLSGTISADIAKTALISLQVSEDGQAIESVNVAFTELKCEGFSAGSSSSTAGTNAPIVDGVFEIKSSDIGEITGQFTSPSEAKGTIHLAFFDGQAECGTWDWSAAE